jgi:hypothetical protein
MSKGMTFFLLKEEREREEIVEAEHVVEGLVTSEAE